MQICGTNNHNVWGDGRNKEQGIVIKEYVVVGGGTQDIM